MFWGIVVILALYPIVMVIYLSAAWYYNNRIYPKKKYNWEHNFPGSVEAGKYRPEPIEVSDTKKVLGSVTAFWILLLMAFVIASD